MPSAQKRIPFQQVTVEYHVLGDLDGVTLAPNVVLDPSSEDFNEADDRGIHVVDVPGNLGLIDPDLIGPATQGDRCIPWFFLDTNGIGGLPTSRVVVADNVQRNNGVPVPTAQFTKFLTGGVPVFYSDLSTWVPQGSVLALAAYAGDGVKIVRLNIVAPQDAEEFANILEACCCSAAECADPPEITDIDSDQLNTPGIQDVTFDVNGGGIDESEVPPTLWLVQESDGEKEDSTGGAIEGTFVTSSPGTVTFRFDVPGGVPPGTYTPVVASGLEQNCNNAEQSPPPATLLVWPAGCPVMDDPQPGAPAVLSIDGGPQAFAVSGANFDGPAVEDIRLISQTTGEEMGDVSFVTDNDNQLTVTANPQSPGDATGFYDILMIPMTENCPNQKVLGVVRVDVS
jgi:hypothetical protein